MVPNVVYNTLDIATSYICNLAADHKRAPQVPAEHISDIISDGDDQLKSSLMKIIHSAYCVKSVQTTINLRVIAAAPQIQC